MEKQEASKRSQILCIIQVIVEYLANIMVMDSFLAIITKELGISTAGTGMLTSIQSVTSFFVLGALVFRKKSIKKYVLMTYCVGFILLLAYYIVPVFHMKSDHASVLLMVIAFVAYALINVFSSRRTAWFIALNDAKNRAKVMAIKSAGSLIAGIVLKNVLAYVYQIYLAENQVHKYFVCCAIVMGVFVLINILCICFMEEPAYVELAEEEHHRLASFKDLLKSKKTWSVFKVTFIVAICNALVTPFLGSYKMTDLGFSLSYDAMIVSITSVIGGVFSFLWGIYADRRNCTYAYRKCMTVMALAYAVNIFVVPDNGKTTYLIFCAYTIHCVCRKYSYLFQYVVRKHWYKGLFGCDGYFRRLRLSHILCDNIICKCSGVMDSGQWQYDFGHGDLSIATVVGSDMCFLYFTDFLY